MQRIVLLKLRHSYGGAHVYLDGSLFSIAARLLALGHTVQIIDLNIDTLETAISPLKDADLIGCSLTGSPDIPSLISLLPELAHITDSPVMLGGQVIERLAPEQFQRIFHSAGQRVMRVGNDADLAALLNCREADLPSPNAVAFRSVWEKLPPHYLPAYLQREGTLVVSQGCHFNCSFCAASKGQRESFRDLGVFTSDLRYLATVAKQQGIEKLRFYCSSLDFFQNPKETKKILEAIAEVRQQSGVDIRVRALSCLVSLRKAAEQLPGLETLLERAGFWCVGLGADGADPDLWAAEKKSHNSMADLWRCLDLCRQLNIRPELLMVMGFPEDTPKTLARTFAASLIAIVRWNALLHPYLAKPFVPGNEGWMQNPRVQQIVDNPRQFFNLDFAALGSRLTHPRRIHRWLCNVAYLAHFALLMVTGRCTTAPLLPQGSSGISGRLAQWINQHMPFDR